MSLSEYSDDMLRKELAAREEAAREKRNAKLSDQHQFVVDNVDLLLQLCPEHDRTSCSDENVINFGGDGCPRCKRCSLLHVKEAGYNGYDVVVELQLSHQGLEYK